MACAVSIAPGGFALAQVVERNLPPVPPSRPPAIQFGADDLLKNDDATPLGVNVRAVILIGAGAAAEPRVDTKGIDVSRIEGVDAAAMRERLAPFLGRPLSRKLIAEVQAEVATFYRDAGRPFVSVTLPPQEVSSGALQIRVVVFKVNRVTVSGAAPENYQGDRIRIVPGREIDTRRLEVDLDWANRNPFRQVETVFAPGKEIGTTDVTIQVTDRRPWQVHAGYANSGTRLTDRDRYFVGAMAAPIGDVVASYQLTGSANFWSGLGRGNETGGAKYQSHAGRVLTPLGLRSSLEVVSDHVETNERPNGLFRIRTTTSQASAVVRTALSDLVSPAFGDLLAGVEFKRQQRVTFFGGVPVGQGQADVAQWVIGWSGRWSDALGSNNLDLRLKSNPGGLLPGNEGRNWSLFTNGRIAEVRNTFATVDYGRVTPLPMGSSLKTDVSALLSSQPLPDTERIGLGGAQAVRGYVSEDGVVDQAAIIRNSIYLPSLGMPGQIPGKATPFVLADIGWGRDIFLRRDHTLASVGAGVGFGYPAVPNVNSSLTAALALRDGLHTPSGSWRFSVQTSVSY